MGKLPMCRICLVENVRMYVVVNKNLHELYEKLTDVPFVTEDSRPILACSFCCAKLKQCFRLMRKCLEAEELFTQMMDEDCELNPSTKHDPLEFCSGFIKCEVEHISIDDGCQTESIGVKEELPDVCETQDDIIEPKEEYQSDDLEAENLDNTGLDKEDMLPHISDSDSESDVPLTTFKIEVEEHDVEKLIAKDTNNLEAENLDNTSLGIEDIPPHISDSDTESDVPLAKYKTEVEEHKVEKRRAEETNRTTVTKKAKLDTRRSKQEDTITAELEKNEQSNLKLMETTQNRTSRSDTYVKKPDQRSLYQVEDFRQDTRKGICEKKTKFDSQQSLGNNKHLTKHNQIDASEKKFKCDVCQRSFGRKDHLITHIQIHTGEKRYKCDLCHRRFTRNDALRRHNTLIHTGETPFKCDICQRSYSSTHSLKIHFRKHTGEKPYKCDTCQRSFTRSDELRNHVRTHTGEKPYKCDACPRSFNRKHHLKVHILIHTVEKPFKCNVCQKCFARNDDLKKHILIHTSEKKSYKCEICQRRFYNTSTLNTHIRIHTGEKSYKCDICQRSFTRKYHLRKHINQCVAGESPFKCKVCQRRFTQNDDLRTHILIHTGGKSYKCDICQRSFTRNPDLRKHIRIHTGETPFKCDLCPRSFTLKSHLTRHNRVHTGEKPFKCDICQRSFALKNTLSYHILTHSGKTLSGLENRQN